MVISKLAIKEDSIREDSLRSLEGWKSSLSRLEVRTSPQFQSKTTSKHNAQLAATLSSSVKTRDSWAHSLLSKYISTWTMACLLKTWPLRPSNILSKRQVKLSRPQMRLVNLKKCMTTSTNASSRPTENRFLKLHTSRNSSSCMLISVNQGGEPGGELTPTMKLKRKVTHGVEVCWRRSWNLPNGSKNCKIRWFLRFLTKSTKNGSQKLAKMWRTLYRFKNIKLRNQNTFKMNIRHSSNKI